MTRKCCRSTPRCPTCPVRAAAAARGRRELGAPGALVAEVLAGRQAQPLPDSVAAALASLDLARIAR